MTRVRRWIAQACRVRAGASLAIGIAIGAVSLAACSDPAAPPASAASLAAEREGASDDDAGGAVREDLQAGQRLQGTITLDIGEGPRTYRVLATRLADDLGRRAAERLASEAGKAELEKANARFRGPDKVGASDVQGIADAFAGKTIHSAQVRTIDVLRRQQVSIEGEATDGSKVTLGFSLAIGGDEALDPSLEFQPAGKRAADRFEAKSRRGGDLRLELDRLQRGSSDTWSVAGSFEAKDMRPGVLAKGLAGQTLPRASGRFDIAELHVRAR